MGNKIYVGNISFKATEDNMKELFARFGEVKSVNLIKDTHTGQSKGFGFVEMGSEEEAKNAIASLDRTTFMERTISVAEAKPQQPRERRGHEGKRGGYGGGGYGGGRGHGGRERR